MSNYTTTSVDNSHFNMWMPLVGIYIAGATFVCVIAAAVDLWKGFRTRQYWIPSNWTSLNAASIAVITAASKLSLDLSTPMPRQIDQLSKLGTSAFLCIALANAAPSMGKWENGESFANSAALSICVISSVVGICIQLTNGVIFTFRAAHITMVVTMSIILFRCVASTLVLLWFRSSCSVKYDTKHQKALEDVKNGHPTTQKLKQYLERFSMMAHSGCPHFILAQFPDCTSHVLCGLVAAIAFFIILIASIAHKEFLGPTSRSGTSNFDWSVLYILISQTLGIGVGIIVLCIRGYNVFAIHRGKVGLRTDPKKCIVTRENYWMEESESSKWLPFLPYIEYKQQKGLESQLKYPFFMAHFFSKLLLYFIDTALFKKIPSLFWLGILSVVREHPHCDEDNPVPEDLKTYFLPSLTWFTNIEKMMESISYVSKSCLREKGRETEHLRELLKEYLSYGFEGVFKFRVPTLDSEDEEPIPPSPPSPPPHSWSLSVLTLTWIATVLPNTDPNSSNKLRKSVMEGLVYVKLIEDNFNNKHDFNHCKFNASLLWLKLEVTDIMRFYRDLKWIPKDRFGDKTARGTLESIKESVRSFITEARSETWRLVGAHHLYGACETILEDCRNDPDDSMIFNKLRRIISDILGACLINLKSYFILACERCSSIEKRREAACEILKLFGKTERIMKILEEKHTADIPPADMVSMDSWHRYHHHHNHSKAEASDYRCNL